MAIPSTHARLLRRTLRLLPLLIGVGACSLRPPTFGVPTPGEMTTRVRALLSSDERAPIDFRRARVELEELGPGVDSVLIMFARDLRARPVMRANALLLLAERRVPAALTTLQWALFNSEAEVVREAAVLGLYRFVPESMEAQNAIRSAVADPSPRVRLNALQSLDVHDINAIRALLRTERHALVREIAVQYLTLSESRGAPLLVDEDGAFRTAGLEHHPRLVFRPTQTAGGGAEGGVVAARGFLGVEMPGGAYLPLAYDVEMVNHVLPAFFSPDRSIAVMEAGRSIVVRDLDRREALYLGPGIAPRAIPFTDSFLFLRERTEEGGAVVEYDVFRAGFDVAEPPERIGMLRVDLAGGERSPVRWMTVGESPEGWVLRVEGTTVFEAPHRSVPYGGEEPAERSMTTRAPRGEEK